MITVNPSMNQSMAQHLESKSWTPDKCIHAMIQGTMKVTMAAGVSWRHPEGGEVHVEVRKCMACHITLPLGESNDTPESEVEVVAVEIALMTDEEREDLPFYQVLAFAEGHDDSALDQAFRDYGDSPTALAEMTYNAGERAAWLAAQIIQHEIEGDPQ